MDPVTGLTRQFTFNGDNKQIEVIENGVSVGRYFYDGEGKRVKKIVGNETTVFVYSSGKLVAEYSTNVPAQGSINYTTTDHLGSPRVITDQFGQVKSRRIVRENIEFEIDLDRDLQNIEADPGQIEQVIVNLAINAQDAMPFG